MSEDAQGTDAWHKQRLGKATASRIADVIARTKNGWGASRENYKAELITERITGVPYPSYVNQAMKYGTEIEPRARAAYAFYIDTPVKEVGFIDHPKIKMSGASADGLVGKDGGCEFKCPETKTHLATLLGTPVDGRYITQINWNLACRPERKWMDWVSFDCRVPEKMQLKVIRIERNDKTIAELEQLVSDFLAEINSDIRQLEKIYGKFELPEAA